MSTKRIKKHNCTEHAVERAYQRTGLYKKEIEQISKSAYHHGLSAKEIKNKELYKYVIGRCRGKLVKLYNNMIFIFTSKSGSLITLYELPKRFRDIIWNIKNI